MGNVDSLSIEVVYATADQQSLISLKVAAGCDVGTAIVQSGIQLLYPEIDLRTCGVGIFSRRVSLECLLKDGDRIEIYRPLKMDPKQARLLRAVKKKI